MKNGEIFLLFERNSSFQVLGSPKPVTDQKKSDATLRFI